MRSSFRGLSVVVSFVLITAGGVNAADVKWGSIAAYNVKLFYPGVTSWEFLTSKNHGVGMVPVVKRKKACPDCHVDKSGNLDLRSQEIVNGSLSMKASKEPFEPAPVEGKQGIIDADIQAAYDNENIYLRVQWNSAGKTWKGNGENPDRISLQLNSSNDDFSKFGCFVTCHSDQNSMPDSPSKDKVAKNSFYSKLKRDDVRLYASYTRNDGWDSLKNIKEIEEISKAGGLIDLWEATFKSKGMDVVDGWILEDRQEDQKDLEGSGNWDGSKYSVVFKRKLKTSDMKDIEFQDGGVVTVGIAVHDDKAKLRKHYVSYPLSIGLGTEAMVKAVKLK